MTLPLPTIKFTSLVINTDNFAKNEVYKNRGYSAYIESTFRVYFKMLTIPTNNPGSSKLLFSIDSSINKKIFNNTYRNNNKIALAYTKTFKLRQAYYKATTKPSIRPYLSGCIDNILVSWFETNYTVCVNMEQDAWVGYLNSDTPDTNIKINELIALKKPPLQSFANYSSINDSSSKLTTMVLVTVRSEFSYIIKYPLGQMFLYDLENFTKIAAEYIVNNHFLNLDIVPILIDLVSVYLGSYGPGHTSGGHFNFINTPMYQAVKLVAYGIQFHVYYHIEDL